MAYVENSALSWLTPTVLLMATWMIGWGAWVTTKLMTTLTKEDHKTICDDRNKEIDKRLDVMGANIDRRFTGIERALELQNAEAKQQRHDSRESSGELKLAIAVLTERIKWGGHT